MADAASAVLPQKEAPALRGVSSITEAAEEEEFVDVPCERCTRAAAVRLGSGDIVVTCAACKARFWVDTDELARKRELTLASVGRIGGEQLVHRSHRRDAPFSSRIT